MQGATERLELFRCDRQAMNLTRAGCARLWRAAQDQAPKAFESKWHCRACPIGAANAGEAAPQEAADEAAAVIALEGLCPRCLRTGARLIGGNLCVSCYNRAAEIARGRNRKGNFPKVVASRFGDVDLLVSEPGEAAAVAPRRFAGVTSAPEAMVTAAKRAKGKPLTFSRPPAPAFLAPASLAPALATACAA